MHLEDADSRASTSLVATAAARTDFAEVGAGTLDVSTILSAAREAGVQQYFVELDRTPGDPMESRLRKSYACLMGLTR